jgi:putative Mg2+ transporter-C (MgtC) family protein
MEIIDTNQLQIIGQVILAMILGAIMGIEREYADKPAGLRTHMLVAGAAALFVALSNITVQMFGESLGHTIIRADPIRVMEAVITGISFLGAGTILRRSAKRQVEGLTTAASILMAAGLGIAIALSQLVLAVGVVVVALLTLRGVALIESKLPSRPGE